MILFITWLFYFPKNILSQEKEIIINEIAWMGTEASANDEWIELYNNTDSDIDLEGWSIFAQDGSPSIELSGIILANDFFLLERTDDDSVPTKIADIIYSGALGNTGEILELIDNNGDVIDVVNMGDSWVAGDNAGKKTMQFVDGIWQTSGDVGGTPQEINEINQENEEAEETEQLEEEDEEEIVSIKYESGMILINEFVSDPTDGAEEWIELYNISYQDIDLTGWYSMDGSETKTMLDGMIMSGGFFIIENPKGNLNNSGDEILLKAPDGTLIDKVVYGEWGGNLFNANAPVASDPFSTARKINAQNSFNNSQDFVITSTLTKNKANIITNIEEATDEYSYCKDIIISEILPNPADGEEEFIELYNKSDVTVSLLGWKIGDESKRKYEFKCSDKDCIIKPKKYFVVYRSESKIALNNSGDSVEIFEPLQDRALFSVEYEKSSKGQSYNFDLEEKEWSWQKEPTPGAKNKIEKINTPPVITVEVPDTILVGKEMLFDATDTLDEDGDDLFFNWDFGDGINLDLISPGHTYLKEGEYILELEVNDGENSVKEEKIVKVVRADSLRDEKEEEEKKGFSKIIISEILPNPVGSDADGEFIEIQNIGTERENLINWSLDDAVGGSKEYKFKFDFWIESGEILSIGREDSQIALNNTNDQVRLINPAGEVVDLLDYSLAQEGLSYAIGLNGKWFWTDEISPGSENIISMPDNDEFFIEQIKIEETGFQEIDLANIDELKAGDKVKIKGIVAVEPGIIGSQYFYLTGERGIQIYNYKKDFPPLEVGDYIEVEGEISIVNEEKRIKTKQAQDMRILETDKEIEIQEIDCGLLGDDLLGNLVKVSGEVVEKKSSYCYIDDGSGEVRVYIKKGTNVDMANINEGDEIETVGILGKTESGLRVIPRSNLDLKVMTYKEDNVLSTKVMGEIELKDEWEIEARNRKKELFKYFISIVIGFVVVLIYLLFKFKKLK